MSRKPSPRVSGALLVAGANLGVQVIRAWSSYRERSQNERTLQHAQEAIGERASGFWDQSRRAAKRTSTYAPGSVQRRLPDWATPDPWYIQHRTGVISSALAGTLVLAGIAIATASRRFIDAPLITERARLAAHRVYESATVDQSQVKTAIEAGGGAIGTVAESAVSDTSAATTAATAAVKEVAVEQAQERVVEPVKETAVRYGAMALAGLTLYIIVVSAIVQLAVVLIS